MDFEFDAEKSASTKDQHGIDFSEARRLGLQRQSLLRQWIMDRLSDGEQH